MTEQARIVAAGHVHITNRVNWEGIVRVTKPPMDSVLGSRATDQRQGFMKALVGDSDDRILGFTMIGAAAGEVMAAA